MQQQIDRHIELLVHAIFAPLIVYPGSDFGRPEQRQNTAIERMKKLTLSKGQHDGKATDYECLLYLMSVTQVMPPNNDTYNCIAYLFRKQFGDDMANQIGFENSELDYSAKALLDGLGTWIFKHQREAIKEKLK